MNTLSKEPASLDKTYCSCFEVKASTLDCHYHSHSQYEIVRILSGYGRRFVNSHVDTFEPGDLILLGSAVPHMYYTDPQESLSPSWAHAQIVHFGDELLNEKNPLFTQPALVADLLKRSQQGLRFLGQTRKQAFTVLDKLIDTTECSQDSLLGELLDILAAHAPSEAIDRGKQTVKINNSETARRFNQACEYINQNFARDLGQAAVANLVDMSPSTFSRFFKVTSGKPFIQFVTDIRIEQACRLLRETDMSIMEIGNASGFCNLSNFNRRFKDRMHRTPLKYRQNYIRDGVWRNNEVT